MAGLVSLVLFFILMAAITSYGYRRYARPARLYEQLGSPVISAGSAVSALHPQEADGLVVRVIQQIGEKVPMSPQDATATRRELIAAGFRGERAVSVYYGIKVTMAVVLFVLALLFADRIAPNNVIRIGLIIVGACAGYFLPSLKLEKMVAKRQERLRLSLPDALDLMVVTVEAGLGLDQAIMHVSKEIQMAHRDLAEEFSLVNLEMRAGKRRSDALKNLAERTGEPELRKLIAILVQTDRFGTSMAESLRTHSDFMRVRRRQQAEERAGKVGVKLVFPIFFFILPAMLLVSAGPGLLQVFKYLFPMMRSFGT
jgi:tight adherence protein C